MKIVHLNNNKKEIGQINYNTAIISELEVREDQSCEKAWMLVAQMYPK